MVVLFQKKTYSDLIDLPKPEKILNVGRPLLVSRTFTDTLAPSPIFPPTGEPGWVKVEVTGYHRDTLPHGSKMEVRGRTYFVMWDGEHLWMKELTERRSLWEKIKGWF